MLEDNDERIAAFQKTIGRPGTALNRRSGATRPSSAQNARNISTLRPLISLDHDLIPARRAQLDRGRGLDPAQFHAASGAGWPVIIHSTDADRAYSRHNKLRIAGWAAEQVVPIGTDWVQALCLEEGRETMGLEIIP
jgi:hypothetical protein